MLLSIIFLLLPLYVLGAAAPTVYLNITLSSIIPIGKATVANTILVLAKDETSSYDVTAGLTAYGIPYRVVFVPQTSFTLPSLTSSSNRGLYGGIVLLSEVAYSYSDGFRSALTTNQLLQLYSYQIQFGVRMVRLDAFPSDVFGVQALNNGAGCCGSGVEQLIRLTDNSKFPTAGLRVNAGLSTQGLYHFPAKISNASIATQFAAFGPSSDGTYASDSVAGVINTFTNRQQLVTFINQAGKWSSASNFLQHAWINWMTRGLFAGYRKTYYNSQVDDVHLKTRIYNGGGTTFRTRPEDMDAHVSWQADLNSRLPAGSNYTIEMAHNGNYDIENALAVTNFGSICNPPYAIYPTYVPPPAELEYMKPLSALGTGTDNWPTTPTNYTWSSACALSDPLAAWFNKPVNMNKFSHLSHTYTHENLNNCTYSDVVKEITFNQQWFAQMGFNKAARFSPRGLVPPAITGMHNGDAIKAMMDNGIIYVVGDNTRPVLTNSKNEYWALTTSIASNGYTGLTIMPRWSVPIYYDCDTSDCTLQEWIDKSGGSGDYNNLLSYIKGVASNNLLKLHHDPFMFHQANMRAIDMPSFSVGSYSGKLSLLMSTTETILQEMTRLTTWPILSAKHDDMAQRFINRQTRDGCNYNLDWVISTDGKSINGGVVTATNNKCSTPIPISIPGKIGTVLGGTYYTETIGSDPTTVWIRLNGLPVSFTLASPISV